MAIEITDQISLWDAQHAQRGNIGAEGGSMLYRPNDAAVTFARMLKPGNLVLEAGSANGRDARYWANMYGIKSVCLDFSAVALGQLRTAAVEQGVANLLTPIQFDINAGTIPFAPTAMFNGFYARSALHIDDNTMTALAHNLCARLNHGAAIVIEGKSPQDPKIARSLLIGPNLVADPEENGHIRRVWTKEFAREMCEVCGWDINELGYRVEGNNGSQSHFLRLVARKV